MSEAISQFHRQKEERQSTDPDAVERRAVAEALRQQIDATGTRLGAVGLFLINQIASGERSIDDIASGNSH